MSDSLKIEQTYTHALLTHNKTQCRTTTPQNCNMTWANTYDCVKKSAINGKKGRKTIKHNLFVTCQLRPHQAQQPQNHSCTQHYPLWGKSSLLNHTGRRHKQSWSKQRTHQQACLCWLWWVLLLQNQVRVPEGMSTYQQSVSSMRPPRWHDTSPECVSQKNRLFWSWLNSRKGRSTD